MPGSNDVQRIALLLTGLGSDVLEPALAGLSEQKAAQVRSAINQLDGKTPETDELTEVLDEFDTFFRFALQTANAPSNWADELFAEATAEDPEEGESYPPPPPRQRLKIFQPTDDPVIDLQRLQPVQVAGALASEQPRIIGMVLSCLDNATAAQVLDLLPEEQQPDAFFALQQQTAIPPDLLARIARTTVEKAALIEPAELENPDGDQKTADLLRALPKHTRARLMDQMQASDPETAARLQELLHAFDDIVSYDNRSVQKLLGQVDTQVLVVALQDVDEEISTRIFENLSKRATAALQEEIEFRQAAGPDEVAAARKEIATLIAQLDSKGELNELP
ncbi:MAG: FliG C-terminal domain-containing protein [Pirellulaceae bacterium]